MIPGTICLPGGTFKEAAFQGVYNSTASASSYTFSSVNFGYPDIGRVIVIGLSYYEYDTTADVSSLTVAGSAATKQRLRSNEVPGGTGSFIYAGIWSIPLATGTTGSVVINFTGGALGLDRGCSIGVWSLYNISSSTPQESDGGTGNSAGAPAQMTTIAQANDIIVSVAAGAENAGVTDWVNITENYDTRVTGSGRLSRSGASSLVLSSGTVNFSAANADGETVAVFARWR